MRAFNIKEEPRVNQVLILKYIAYLEHGKESSGAGRTCLWNPIVGNGTGEALDFTWQQLKIFRNGAALSSLCFAWEYCHSVMAKSI